MAHNDSRTKTQANAKASSLEAPSKAIANPL